MFVTDDDKSVKWYWIDGKMHEVNVKDKDDNINLKDLHETCLKLIKEKEETCKNIYYLGVSLTGTGEGGWGFLLGWLARSVKKDQTWNIEHTETDVPREEVVEHLADIMEKSAKMLREHKDDSSVKGVTPSMGSNDGTDLFK